MDVERFDPATDAGAVRACYDIYLAAAAADKQRRPPMSPRPFRSWLTLGWTEDPSQTWLARGDDGQACEGSSVQPRVSQDRKGRGDIGGRRCLSAAAAARQMS